MQVAAQLLVATDDELGESVRESAVVDYTVGTARASQLVAYRLYWTQVETRRMSSRGTWTPSSTGVIRGQAGYRRATCDAVLPVALCVFSLETHAYLTDYHAPGVRAFP